MGLKIYSATKTNNGSIFETSFNSKEENVWLSLKKQTGINVGADGRTNGVYKDGATVKVKLSVAEVGSIIYAIENKGEYSVPHNESSIRFGYWVIEPKTPQDKRRDGFSLTVKKEGVDYKSTFNLGTAETLKEYLKFSLTHIFSAIYAADKEFFKNSKKGQEAGDQTSQEEAPFQTSEEPL